MKKILALILALLMIATTVALSACSNDEGDGAETGNEYENTPGGTTPGSSTDSDEDTDEEITEPAETDWIKKNDYVCVGVDGVALREGPGQDYDSVKTLTMGKKLKRTGTNGRWNKITDNGETYYVSTYYTTPEVEDFEFEVYAEEDQILLNVKEECTINLRSTPFYSEIDAEANLLFPGFGPTETDEEGESLKLIAKSKSGNWYKVSFTGTWGAKEYTNRVCYLKNIKSVVDVVDGLPSSAANGDSVIYG